MAAPKTSLNPKAKPRTKTEEKTLRGRPVWIDNTGEVTGEKGTRYSEISTTIPWGTEWITAPSVDENGKRLSDDEVKQKLIDTLGKDFITGEKLPTFSNQEKAVEYAQWRSDTMFDQKAIEQGFPEEFSMEPEPERKDFIDRSIDKGKDFLEYLTAPSKHGVFNKGGAVMNEQMEMAFMQQGGLKDDGMKRDPVSGNEVPNGSMAKEVRDDIPAQLSEGEYVVPADVVRYLGVKHFEDLRNKAKSGLQNMEANGRIGGEPVPVGGPQAAPMPQPPTPYMAEGGDLSPDEMNEIKMLMNQGGMVAGAAEGSDFGQEFMTQPSVYGGGFSWEDTPGGTPSGVSIADPELPTESPESCELRGMVYNPETKMCEVPIEASPAVKDTGPSINDTGPSINDKQEAAPDPTSWMDSYDYNSDNSLYASSVTALEGPKPGSVEAMLGGIFGGGVLGKLGKAGTAAQIAANIKILESQGSTELASNLQQQLDGYIKQNDLSWIPSFMIDGDQLAAGAGDVLKTDPTSLVNVGANYRTPTAEQIKRSTGRDVTGGGLEEAKKIIARTEKEGPTEKQKEATARVKRALEKSKTTEEILKPSQPERDRRESFAESIARDTAAARDRAAKSAEKAGRSLATGGRATGGLVSRPKKKKK